MGCNAYLGAFPPLSVFELLLVVTGRVILLALEDESATVFLCGSPLSWLALIVNLTQPSATLQEALIEDVHKPD